MAARKPRPPAAPAQKRQAPRGNLPFELPFNIPDVNMDSAMDDMLGEDDEPDEELEAELAALMNGGDVRARGAGRSLGASPAASLLSPSKSPGPSLQQPAPVAPPRKGAKGAPAPSRPHPALVPSVVMDFDLAAIERLGEDDGDDDEDIDEDDPELLAELAELSPDESEPATKKAPQVSVAPSASSGISNSSLVAVLTERLANYDFARQDAIGAKDAGKVRRYERAMKTLQDQIGQAKKGETIPEDDIPPAIFVKSALAKPMGESKPFPSQPNFLAEKAKEPVPALAAAPAVPARAPGKPEVKKEDNMNVVALKSRRDEYRHAALEAKRADNKRDAIRFMNVAKQFETVIAAAESGEAVDLSAMPPHPSQLPPEPQSPAHTTVAKPSGSSVPVHNRASVASKPGDDEEIPEFDAADVKAAFNAPDAPKTILEALQQRLQKYKASAEEAKTAGDSSKARRMERIVKQYQDAIKDVQAKRPVDFNELPTPPGFGPIPIPSGSRPSAAGLPATAAAAGQAVKKPLPTAKPAHPDAAHHASSRESRNEHQYHVLTERAKQLKLAALRAKKEGALETARHYLRQAKGLEPMIEASANGLPVDLNAVPKPPPGFGSGKEENDDFEVVQYEDAGAYRPATNAKNRAEIYTQLEKDLVEQIQMCVKNVQHFKKAGDIPTSEKFEKYNQHSRKDLESLRNAFKHGANVPKFHYETRVFSVVKCCPELPDTVLEFTVLRGFGYTLTGFAASDFTTYVKYEFPFPAEAPQSGKTGWFKGTNEPEYNTPFTIQINRKSRSLARIFKSKGISCEIVVKMGFMKADRVLGSVNVPLEALESKCSLHAAFDLMGGKQAVGGKLEIRARVREPILKQQVEKLQDKWLVIDQFVR